MTRPRKNIVDYFPHDCITGKTISILENKFKNDGYACWFKILEILGSTENHYYDCSDLFNWEYLKTKTLINDDSILNEIVDMIASLGAIDKELWNKKRIIWSDNFIKNLSFVYSKRAAEIPNKPSSRDGNPAKRDIGDVNPQSKVKESKEKKDYGEFKNVKLSDDEYEKLIDRLGNKKTEDMLERLSGYIASKGKKYKSHYATILQWSRKDEKPDRQQSLTAGGI